MPTPLSDCDPLPGATSRLTRFPDDRETGQHRSYPRPKPETTCRPGAQRKPVKRRRHHLVSRGYQRLFACDDRVRLIFKKDYSTRIVGTADAFVEKGFNSTRTSEGELDELEEEWTRLENAALPVVREVAAGRPLDERSIMELKVLAAIHFPRSYALREVFDRIFAEYRTAPTKGMNLPRLEHAFEEQFGYRPSRDELDGLVGKHLDGWHRANVFFVERMAEAHNKALDKLRPLHIQPAWTRLRRVEFLTGDTPVVRYDTQTRQIRVALGDADQFFMPISRTLLVAFTTREEPPMLLAPIDVQRLNNLIWRSCYRQLGCHPDADWQRSLGVTTTP